MILNFQRRFVPMILDLSKGHTIRGERKDGKRPQPGEMLHLYTGLRQPGAEFILRAPCLRTEDLRMRFESAIYIQVWIGETALDWREAAALFHADGFRDRSNYAVSTREAYEFWKDRLPFNGWITYWDTSKALDLPKGAVQ